MLKKMSLAAIVMLTPMLAQNAAAVQDLLDASEDENGFFAA
jgi:hypothetical protein